MAFFWGMSFFSSAGYEFNGSVERPNAHNLDVLEWLVDFFSV